MTSRAFGRLFAILVVCAVLHGGNAFGQITNRRVLSTGPAGTRTATLEEQLTNRLRAVADDQKGFIRHVTRLVNEKKLDVKLVVALERYSLRRNPTLPFPYFARAIRFEADRRGVPLPPVRAFADSRGTVLR